MLLPEVRLAGRRWRARYEYGYDARDPQAQSLAHWWKTYNSPAKRKIITIFFFWLTLASFLHASCSLLHRPHHNHFCSPASCCIFLLHLPSYWMPSFGEMVHCETRDKRLELLPVCEFLKHFPIKNRRETKSSEDFLASGPLSSSFVYALFPSFLSPSFRLLFVLISVWHDADSSKEIQRNCLRSKQRRRERSANKRRDDVVCFHYRSNAHLTKDREKKLHSLTKQSEMQVMMFFLLLWRMQQLWHIWQFRTRLQYPIPFASHFE